MAVQTQHTEVIQRTEPRPCSHPPAEQQTPHLGAGELLVSSRQLSPPETPQTHGGRGAVFQCLPDATVLLRHQADPSSSQCQDIPLWAGGHCPAPAQLSTGSVSALVAHPPSQLGSRRGGLGVFLGPETQM